MVSYGYDLKKCYGNIKEGTKIVNRRTEKMDSAMDTGFYPAGDGISAAGPFICVSEDYTYVEP